MRAGLIIGVALVVAGVCASAPSFAATDATKEISAQRRARIVITPGTAGGLSGALRQTRMQVAGSRSKTGRAARC